MGLDREEVLASPLARLCYRESRFPRFSNPSRSVLRRSSLGSHLERSSVAYYFANFRAWTCDLTRTLDLELMLLRNSLAQKDRLRATPACEEYPRYSWWWSVPPLPSSVSSGWSYQGILGIPSKGSDIFFSLIILMWLVMYLLMFLINNKVP